MVEKFEYLETEPDGRKHELGGVHESQGIKLTFISTRGQNHWWKIPGNRCWVRKKNFLTITVCLKGFELPCGPVGACD